MQTLGKNWVLQQNNHPKHMNKSTTEWPQEKRIKVLQWPIQSPELNLIEMQWLDGKRALCIPWLHNLAKCKEAKE